jgi:ABC-type branched-subunit amino acid transport system substrate-binding protein
MALAASVAVLGLEVSAASAADCVIKIGGMAPLSAPGTVVGGEAMRDAMLIAEDDINAKGGILGCDLDVVIADTEGLPEKASAVMEKLILQDGVVAVGGGYHSSVGVASKDVADSRGIPVVFAETWNDTITGDKQKYIFRIAPLSSWASSTIWQHSLELPGIKKAEDYSGIVERIKAEDPDIIIVLATGEAGYNFQQQAADAGIGSLDIPFHAGQVSLESKAYWENVPDGNMAFVQRIGVPENLFTAEGKAFAKAYKERTGKAGVESYAMEAYDSIAIIAQAINEAGSTDGDAIVTALESIEHNGTLGKIYFPYGSMKDPSVDGHGDEWWHQWPDVALTVIQYQVEGQNSGESPIVWPDAYKTGEAIYVGQ